MLILGLRVSNGKDLCPPKRRPALVFVFLLCDCRDLLTSVILSFCLCEMECEGDTSGFLSSLAENQRGLWIGHSIAEDMKEFPRSLSWTQGRWLFPEPAGGGGSRNLSSLSKATQAVPGLMALQPWESELFRKLPSKIPLCPGLTGSLRTFLPATRLGKHTGLQICYSSSQSRAGELQQWDLL